MSSVTGGRPSVLIQEEGSLWSGLTTQNHLGSVVSANPSEVSKLMTIEARAAGKTNALQTLLASYASRELSNTEFEWELQSSKFNSKGEKVGGLVWRTDNGFDAKTGEAFINMSLKNRVMNLKVSRDER